MLIELGLGYPERLLRAIGHPATWIGRLIGWLEHLLNRKTARRQTRRAAGIAAVLLLLGIVGTIAFVLEQGLLHLPFGLLATGLVASTLVAQRSLHRHVAEVAAALEQRGVASGRAAVAHIVGRDTEALDTAGIARAAIESLAENFSDAVVAPIFWMVIGGLPGAALYKAINTADSMIGHRTARHEDFGWAAARLDDLVNLPASRLSALLLFAAAALSTEASAGSCLARRTTRCFTPPLAKRRLSRSGDGGSARPFAGGSTRLWRRTRRRCNHGRRAPRCQRCRYSPRARRSIAPPMQS